jgi:hypothetical protein
MGVITTRERYKKVIDKWTAGDQRGQASAHVRPPENDDQGFNPVYMMNASGARGSSTRSSSWPACAV